MTMISKSMELRRGRRSGLKRLSKFSNGKKRKVSLSIEPTGLCFPPRRPKTHFSSKTLTSIETTIPMFCASQ